VSEENQRKVRERRAEKEGERGTMRERRKRQMEKGKG